MKVTLRFQVLIIILLIPVLAVFAFLNERQNSIFRIQQYIGIWEDDIAEAVLVKQDTGLLEKIRSQLVLVVPAVQETKVVIQNGQSQADLGLGENSWRRSAVTIPISLNLNPVGELYASLSNQSLLGSALISPVFGLGLLLIMGLSLLFARREFRLEIARNQLSQRLRLEKEFSDLALHVAHDIRSPLMALMTIAGKSGAVAAEYLPLLQNASERIRGIAEELLEKARPRKSREMVSDGNRKEELSGLESEQSSFGNSMNSTIGKSQGCSLAEIGRAMELLVQEFQAQFPNVAWSLRQNSHSDQVVALKLDRLQRMISNILQNSAEAIEVDGKVQIEIFARSSKLHLHIQDSGKGMSEEILVRLMREGGTYGKANGNGLGLKDVREVLAQIGGKFDLQSRPGLGTLIILEIPIVP